MKAHSRLRSLLNACTLGKEVTGYEVFDVPQPEKSATLKVDLPTNVRLGHLVERVISQLIKVSNDYRLIEENFQLVEDKRTIGELDFIVEDLILGRFLHVELAYKFYLYDPTISDSAINNWIGPNRRDSLVEKLDKLRSKQFPLLHHDKARRALTNINVEEVAPALCFMASLYVPVNFSGELPGDYHKAVKGFYCDFEAFSQMDHSDTFYHIPRKTEWGINPSENEKWLSFKEIVEEVKSRLSEHRAPLIWRKNGEDFSEYFVVWW